MKNYEQLQLHVILSAIITLILSSAFYNVNAQSLLRDIEGNTYKTVIIGEQEWMAENLKTTKFNDGLDIPNVTDMTKWVQMESAAYSWYDNDISNKNVYGGLYNWHAVNTGKLCPEGWRVSTDNDWKILMNHLGNENEVVLKLKGFDFLHSFGGYRYGYYWGSGIFQEIDINSYWWTASKCTDTHVWSRTINKKNSKIYRSYFVKNNGFAVRCIKSN